MLHRLALFVAFFLCQEIKQNIFVAPQGIAKSNYKLSHASNFKRQLHTSNSISGFSFTTTITLANVNIDQVLMDPDAFDSIVDAFASVTKLPYSALEIDGFHVTKQANDVSGTHLDESNSAALDITIEITLVSNSLKLYDYWVPIISQTLSSGTFSSALQTSESFLSCLVSHTIKFSDPVPTYTATAESTVSAVSASSSEEIDQATSVPSEEPSALPSTSVPSEEPSALPTASVPSEKPSALPTAHPSHKPTAEPSHHPTGVPTGVPTSHPTSTFTATLYKTQDECFSGISSEYAKSVMIDFPTGITTGNVFTLSSPQTVRLYHVWEHDSHECSHCLIQLYFGIVGFPAKYPNACKDTVGYAEDTVTMSTLTLLESPGCYHLFRAEQFGYYCGFYSLGPVTKGEVIGAVFIEGTPFIPSSQPSANPSAQPVQSVAVSSHSSIDQIFSGSSSSISGKTASSLVKFTISMTLEHVDMVQFLSDDNAFEAVVNAVSSATGIPASSLSVTHFASSKTSSTESVESGIDLVISASVVLESSDATDLTAQQLYSKAAADIEYASSSGQLARDLITSSSVFTGVSLHKTVDLSQPEVTVVGGGSASNVGGETSMFTTKSTNLGKGTQTVSEEMKVTEKTSRDEQMDLIGVLAEDGSKEISELEKESGKQEIKDIERESKSVIEKDLHSSTVSLVQILGAGCALAVLGVLVAKAYQWREAHKKKTEDSRIAEAIMHEREWDQEVDDEYNKHIPHGLRPVHIHRSNEFYRDSQLRNI